MAKTKQEIETILIEAGVSLKDMIAIGFIPSIACFRCQGAGIIDGNCDCIVDWEMECSMAKGCFHSCPSCRGTGHSKS